MGSTWVWPVILDVCGRVAWRDSWCHCYVIAAPPAWLV